MIPVQQAWIVVTLQGAACGQIRHATSQAAAAVLRLAALHVARADMHCMLQCWQWCLFRWQYAPKGILLPRRPAPAALLLPEDDPLLACNQASGSTSPI